MIAVFADVLLKNIGEIKGNPLINEVVTDSRLAKEGTVFVCIKGERVDGHDYAAKAIEQGALAVLAQHSINGVSKEKTIIVQDPLDAMIQIGENYRKIFNPMLVAVTGSVGKTTTKEFCFSVFSQFGNTIKTQGNKNNEIGMPNTLMCIDETTQYAVIEMGMQGLGEISKLTLAAKPMGAIITCIGSMHLQQLKTRENISKAKMEVCEGMPNGSPLVLNADDDFPKKEDIPRHVNAVYFGIENKNANVKANNIVTGKNETTFVIDDDEYGTIIAFIPTVGKHNVMNALSAYTLATRLGLNAQKVAKALANYKTAQYRQNIVQHKGVTVIEDCYNAGPKSVTAALATLGEYPASGKKIAVLGDMLELGDISKEAHSQIADICKENNIDELITYGKEMEYAYNRAKELNLSAMHFKNKQDVAQHMCEKCKQNDIVLVKASRGMAFEDILNYFYEKF